MRLLISVGRQENFLAIFYAFVRMKNIWSTCHYDKLTNVPHFFKLPLEYTMNRVCYYLLLPSI